MNSERNNTFFVAYSRIDSYPDDFGESKNNLEGLNFPSNQYWDLSNVAAIFNSILTEVHNRGWVQY